MGLLSRGRIPEKHHKILIEAILNTLKHFWAICLPTGYLQRQCNLIKIKAQEEQIIAMGRVRVIA